MRKVMKSFNEDKNNSVISLWILVDNYGRIYYTGHDKTSTEEYNHNFLKDKKLQVVELIGTYEKETNIGTET